MRPLVVLASASAVRGRLLAAAGVACIRDPAAVDEGAMKAALRTAGSDVAAAAQAMATAKAETVAARHPGALVIGADQIIECEGVWLDKPAGFEQAAADLRKLRGRTHRIVSAVGVARDREVLWCHQATARLTMRPLSDAFIVGYLERAGPEALESVGAYRLEGLGVQLFSEIEGDYFTILGLPLLPLLEFLRRAGVVDA